MGNSGAFVLTFGKYAGTPIDEIPGPYLAWLRDTTDDSLLAAILTKECSTRDPDEFFFEDDYDRCYEDSF